jgi:prevent-host-death family protein
MSTVATFTVRDLSRRTAEVLAAVRKYGQVEICSRAGEVLTIMPRKDNLAKKRSKKTVDAGAEWAAEMDERKQRMIMAGFVPPKASEWDAERFNRIIAGEE